MNFFQWFFAPQTSLVEDLEHLGIFENTNTKKDMLVSWTIAIIAKYFDDESKDLKSIHSFPHVAHLPIYSSNLMIATKKNCIQNRF